MSESNGSNEKQITILSVLGRALASSFRNAWPAFLGMFLATIAAVFLELAPPLLLRKIIDENLNVGVLTGLPLVATIYFLAVIGASIVNFIQVFVNRYIGQNMILQLRFFMAGHLSKLPISYYSRTPVGDTISRLTSDVETVSTIFSPAGGGGPGGGGFNNLPTNLFKVTGVLIAMFAISPRLALMVLASAPVVYFVSSYFRRNTFRVQNQVRRTVSGINIFLQETFSGMRTIKAYGKEDEYGRRFQKPLEDNLKAVNSAAVYDAYFPCVMQVIRAVVIAVVIWFGARTSVTETLAISLGSLAAMADLVTRYFTPIDAIAGDFQTLQQALAGLKRIVELLKEKPEEKWAARPVSVGLSAHTGAAVAINGVDFSYRQGEPVLGNLSLSVPRGVRVAIVGRTGAGKTTLLNLMAGLYKPDRGTISILGFDPHLIQAHDRRRLLGIVPQNVHIFEGSIKENITLRDGTFQMSDIERAADIVGLHDYINSLPDGYDTLLGVEGTKLSRGQSQLLSLARAIVSDPSILLLDEPTSGVDAVTEASIIQAFRQASRNRTIVTISHRLSGILDAEEVHIMGAGRIVESGIPAVLAGKEGWYSVYRQLENAGWKME